MLIREAKEYLPVTTTVAPYLPPVTTTAPPYIPPKPTKVYKPVTINDIHEVSVAVGPQVCIVSIQGPSHYAFGYAVRDSYSGDDFSHQEQR